MNWQRFVRQISFMISPCLQPLHFCGLPIMSLLNIGYSWAYAGWVRLAFVSVCVLLSACGDDIAPEHTLSPQQAVNHPFFVGNIYQEGVPSDDLALYWSQLTPEVLSRWPAVESVQDEPDWSRLDAFYDYANLHGMLTKASAFVLGSSMPGWMGNLAPMEYTAQLEEWMSDYCHRYPETNIIDVVSEALPGHYPSFLAQRALGDNWVSESFKLARKHCPNATLVLNDYHVLSWNAVQFRSWAADIIPNSEIDAIGAEAHGLEDIAIELIAENLDQLASLGLPVYISEYDISEPDDQKQLEIMQAQFPLFYNHPSVVGITLWGMYEGKTWVSSSHLVDQQGSPRPALKWLMQYLKDHPK